MVEGLHVPEIPLAEVAERTGTLAPVQIVRFVPKLNVGVIFGTTDTVKETESAH